MFTFASPVITYIVMQSAMASADEMHCELTAEDQQALLQTARLINATCTYNISIDTVLGTVTVF